MDQVLVIWAYSVMQVAQQVASHTLGYDAFSTLFLYFVPIKHNDVNMLNIQIHLRLVMCATSENSMLICLKIHLFDVLTFHSILSSLLQHRSSEASISSYFACSKSNFVFTECHREIHGLHNSYIYKYGYVLCLLLAII